MNSKEISNLAVKLGGIYIIVQTILYSPTIISSIYYYFAGALAPSVKQSALIFIGTMGVMLIVGILMVILSGKVAKIGEGSATVKSLKNVAIMVAGLVLSVLAFKNLPLQIADIAEIVTSGSQDGIKVIMEFIGTLIQFGLGLFFFFLAESFGKLTLRK